MTRAARGAMLLLLAGLAACAETAPTDDETVQAASVVRAFANICGRLDAPEVTRRAGSLGFVAVDPTRVPALASVNLPRDGSLQIMARIAGTPGGTTAVLVWNAQGPACELAVGGVVPAAIEREFDRMVATLARQPGLRVSDGQVAGATGTDIAGLQLRRAVLMVSAQQMGAAPQVVVLRAADGPADGTRVKAIMSIHVARPQPGSAIPPPAPAAAR